MLSETSLKYFTIPTSVSLNLPMKKTEQIDSFSEDLNPYTLTITYQPSFPSAQVIAEVQRMQLPAFSRQESQQMSFDQLEAKIKTSSPRILMAKDPFWAYKQSNIQESIALAKMAGTVIRGSSAAIEFVQSTGEMISKSVESACHTDPTMKRMCESIADIHRASATSMAQISEVVVETGRVVGRVLDTAVETTCQVHPTTQKLCRKGADIRRAIGASVTETSQRILCKYANTSSNSLARQLKEGFLIPREVTEQYVKDASTIAPFLIPMGFSANVVKGFVGQAIASRVKLTALNSTVTLVEKVTRTKNIKSYVTVVKKKMANGELKSCVVLVEEKAVTKDVKAPVALVGKVVTQNKSFTKARKIN